MLSPGPPGLREVLVACRAGDTLVVSKLDILAPSLPDARDIVEDPARHEAKRSVAKRSVVGLFHDYSDPADRLLFNVLRWSPEEACKGLGNEIGK